MAIEQSAEPAWLRTPETLQDPCALQGIRKGGGLVSIYDVMRWVTGQPLSSCRATWQRIFRISPEYGWNLQLNKVHPQGPW